MPRPGYEVAELSAFGPRMRWLKLPDGFQMVESNASSTEVRKRAKREWTADPVNGCSMHALNGLVPPAVHGYIMRHRLYAHLASRRPSGDKKGERSERAAAISMIGCAHLSNAPKMISRPTPTSHGSAAR